VPRGVEGIQREKLVGPVREQHDEITAGDEIAGADLHHLRDAVSGTAAKYASANIRPGGSIVLTTGIAGARPLKGWTIAASICGAMVSLTRALAVELAPTRVNAVSPGVVRTALWDNMSEADRSAMYQQVGAALPVGRVGEASDIAESFLYLMREGYGTGQVIVVDGGASRCRSRVDRRVVSGPIAFPNRMEGTAAATTTTITTTDRS